MKKSTWALLVVALAAPDASAQVIGRVSSYDGALDVIRGGIPLSLYPNLALSSGDVVHTRDGRATLRFSDGSELRLSKDTRATVNDGTAGREIVVEFGRVRSASPTARVVRLTHGEARVDVTSAVVEYAVAADGAIGFGVLAGTAEASAEGRVQLVTAGMRSVIPPGGVPSAPGRFRRGEVFTGPNPTAIPVSAAATPPSATPIQTPIPTPIATPVPTPIPTPTPIGTRLVDPSDVDADTVGDEPSDREFVDQETYYDEEESIQTQGEYAAQLINALGIASALPANATVNDMVQFLERLGIEPCREKLLQPDLPTLPFSDTTDLYVGDSGSGSIVRIDPGGDVVIAVPNRDIIAETRTANVSIGALAFDVLGALYFVDRSVTSVLRFGSNGALSTLVTGDTIGSGPRGLAVGIDGQLLVTGAQTVVSIDVESGEGFQHATLGVGHLLAAEDGTLFVLDGGEPNRMLRIAADGGTAVPLAAATFGRGEHFTTRAANGSLVVADSSNGTIYQVTPAGGRTILLSAARLEDVAEHEVLLGAVAYDSEGKLYVIDRTANSILRFEPNKDGQLEKGKAWVKAKKIAKETGAQPNLDAGMAFMFRASRPGGWQPDAEIELDDLLCIANIDPSDPDAPLAIPIGDMIEIILEQNSDLFWLQSRRVLTVSPFAP